MTWTLVQKSASVNTSGSGTTTPTLPGGSTAGNLLVACVGSATAGTQFTGPAGWKQAVQVSTGSNCRAELWYLPVASNGGGITSAAFTSGTGQVRGALAEFNSTVTTSIALNLTGTGTASSSTTCTVAANASAGDLVVCSFLESQTSAADTWTDPSGFTLLASVTASNAKPSYSAYQLSAAGGAFNITATSSTTSSPSGFSGVAASFTASASAGMTVNVGATINTNDYPKGTTRPQAQTLFAAVTGRPVQVVKLYYGGLATWPINANGSINLVDHDIATWIARGVKALICLSPAFNPTDSATFTGIQQLLSGYKNAGLTAEVCLFQEAAGHLSVANYAAVCTYYGPAVTPYYPFVASLNYEGAGGDPQNFVNYWNALPAGTFAKGYMDFYAREYLHGATLDGAAAAVDAQGVPFGLAEWGCNPAVDGIQGSLNYMAYIKTFMSARVTASLPISDIIWYGGPGPGNSLALPITNPPQPGTTLPGQTTDCRIPDYQAVFDAFAGTSVGAPGTVTISATVTTIATPSGTLSTGTPLTVTTTSLPGATQSVAYSAQLTATGGVGPDTWSVTVGTLPAGLTLHAATGVIDGTPTGTGTSSFTVKATDISSNTATAALSIVVSASGTLNITSATPPQGTVGSVYTFTLAATGGTPGYSWALTAGALPPGLSVSVTGIVSGVPTGAGTYMATITVTDQVPNTASAVLPFTVVAATTQGGAPAPGMPGVITEIGVAAAPPVVPAGTFLLNDTTSGVLNLDTLGIATAWADVSTYVRSFTTARTSTRNQSPVISYDPGTYTGVWKNSDGRFDPDNLAGPYVAGGATQIHPMTPIRVRAVYGGITYPLINVFADAWASPDTNLGPNYAEADVSGTDGFKVLAGFQLAAAAAEDVESNLLPEGGGEDSGARITRLLNIAGWDTTARMIDVGNSTQQGTNLTGPDALTEMQLSTDTELGELYVNGAGYVVFRRRHGVLEDARSTVPQAIFGDNPGAGTTLNSNTGFENASTSGWATQNNATIQVTGSASYAGALSCLIFGDGATANPTMVTSPHATVSPGQYVTFSAWMQGEGHPWPVNLVIRFYDAAGNHLTSYDSIAAASTASGVWGQLSTGSFVPANAVNCTGAIILTGTPPASGYTQAVDEAYLQTASELPYSNLGRADDDTQLCNDAQITAAGSANLQEAMDAASIAKFLYARSYQRTDLLLESDAEALEWAQFIVYISKGAEDRFDTITLSPLRDTRLWPHALGRDIGDMIGVIRRPPNVPAITKQLIIRGITHTVTNSPASWTTQWILQDASRYSFLTLSEPVAGKLGNNALAY